MSRYWAHYRRTPAVTNADELEPNDDDGFDAWEAVEDAVSRRDPGLVALLVALAEAVADDEYALAYLGAGPIETLLRHGSGPLSDHLLDGLGTAVRQHPELRVALDGVWWSDDDDPKVAARFGNRSNSQATRQGSSSQAKEPHARAANARLARTRATGSERSGRRRR